MHGLASAAIIVIFAGTVTRAVAVDAVQHKVLTLSVVNGAVAGVGDTVKVQQGDDLELRWSSDKPIELHLHGRHRGESVSAGTSRDVVQGEHSRSLPG